MVIITSALLLTVLGISLGYLRLHKNRSKYSIIFLEKYDALYRSLTNKRPAEIIKSNSSRIIVKLKVNSDVHYFGLEELDARLLITWKLDSTEYGKTAKEWSFNTNSPQNWMYEEVLGDIREFQLNQIKQKRMAVPVKEFRSEASHGSHLNIA